MGEGGGEERTEGEPLRKKEERKKTEIGREGRRKKRGKKGGRYTCMEGAGTQAYAIRHRIRDRSLRIEVSIFLLSTNPLNYFMKYLCCFRTCQVVPQWYKLGVNRKWGPSYPVYKHRPFFPVINSLSRSTNNY